MRILLLTTHLNIGGIGVYTANLARYLKKRGVDVTVASSGGDLEDTLAEGGVPHIKIDIRTKSEFGIKVWKALPVLAGVIRDGGFHILHAQTRVAQVLGYFAGRITRVPFVSTCHGFFKYRRLSRRFFPCWGEKVIAISKSVRKHLLEDFCLSSGRVVLIYNGIELERYIAGRVTRDHDLIRSMGLAGDTAIIGAVGRLSSVKGFKYLISAFKDVISRDRSVPAGGVRLLIVGEGPEKGILQEQIRKLGIADSVFLTPGSMPLEKYLSLLDIFCLPSVHEGLGLSLMEAMAAGRACIASDVGGLSELITSEENGILVPPKDPKALMAAILRLLKDDRFRRRLGDNARKKAADSFSINESVAQTLEVYREVAGGRHG
ncbi:MAG: hypothetical protein DRP85_03665 [Candidatus Makaraimicrobium thalassicum]|nr:MAG: hypothetical protein DRP85_03665 [Candidatus Omnitrophota bacterium]